MQSKISRRAMVKGGLIAGAFIPAMGLIANTSTAASLPPLDPKDPTAQALGFVTDATKVDAKANATYKPDQKCATCAQFQGQGERCDRRLQYLCRQERAGRRLVQGLGAKTRLAHHFRAAGRDQDHGAAR